jgi:hypothetical protein
MFLGKPHLRPYFYLGQSPDRLEDSLEAQLRQSEIAAVCELITGLLEHAVVQRPNIPKHSWEDCWLQFLKEMYKQSPALNQFYWENRHFYAVVFRTEVEAVLGRHEPPAA